MQRREGHLWQAFQDEPQPARIAVQPSAHTLSPIPAPATDSTIVSPHDFSGFRMFFGITILRGSTIMLPGA
jgi:hypothetical protein